MTNKLRPFDRLDWITIVLVALFALALLSGCSMERNAARKCAKAESRIKEAIELCPSVMTAKVERDTIVVYTEPSAGAGERSYSQASMDSLATICSRLVSKYRAKADSAITHDEVRYLTRALCDFETITVADTNLLLKIWTEKGKVRYFYNVLPRTILVPTEKAVRTFTTEPCPPQGRVKSWGWAGAVWGLIAGLVIGFVLCLFLIGSFRS